MANKSSNFFSAEEQQRIEATVEAAEQCTSGEIVPMVVGAAYDYPRAEIIGGGFFALAFASLISWWWWHASLWAFLPAFLILYLPCKWLIRFIPALKRRLIAEAEIEAEVEEKALVSFVEQGLHHTRDNTGILILICLFEHRVEVLADRGINALVPKDTWQEIVAIVTDGLRRGQACDALCQAIERCGEILTDHFPRREDDTNELPNLIID
jgi:putative membrane protein